MGCGLTKFGSARMIQDAIIEALLHSGDFLTKLVELIVDKLWPDGEDESDTGIDFEALIIELEPKLTSMIDSRIHGMEKRLGVTLNEIEESFRKEIAQLIESLKDRPPAPVVAPPETSQIQMEVKTAGTYRRPKPARRR